MLMERRKREVQRAQHNHNIVVTFSGPAHVDLDIKVDNNAENISEEEDGCPAPLPFAPSTPVSLCGGGTEPCCPLPTKKLVSDAFFDYPGTRCVSPCSDINGEEGSECDYAEHTSTSTSISSDRPRCSSPTGWEFEDDESDEELRECRAVISALFQQD
ncbi:hypothetical protein MVEN_01919500 [Mycena venus]|uniref:Uncharacterized protein n=1 Tax=Mycena venus TaxID=2733690 RepID=A0A8H7CLR8_9AGAR|nr:hypothetical protein MVEN_01919500 [Mycena venus]